MFLEITNTVSNYLIRATLILRDAVRAYSNMRVVITEKQEDSYTICLYDRSYIRPSIIECEDLYQARKNLIKLAYDKQMKDQYLPVDAEFFIEEDYIKVKLTYNEHSYYNKVADYMVNKIIES
jgi:hypothetical protein